VKRVSHGLQLNLNYTYSKNIDDAGTVRSGWPIPAALLISHKSWTADRIDRAVSTNSVPQNLSIFGVYRLPFGKGGIGGDNWVVRNVAGGWMVSSVFTYVAGTPLTVTASSCSSTFQPTGATCMPDLNPAFTGTSIRQNGSWGKGATAANLGAYQYLTGNLSTTPGAGVGGGACATTTGPYCNPQNFLFGDAPRTMAFNGLRAPGVYNLNASVRRSFNLTPERVKFIFAVDCQNVTNKVTFGGIATGVDAATFGTISSATGNSGSRDFQFSGRLNF
jgi:hypothetical protein